jgi:hypothetical protein
MLFTLIYLIEGALAVKLAFCRQFRETKQMASGMGRNAVTTKVNKNLQFAFRKPAGH